MFIPDSRVLKLFRVILFTKNLEWKRVILDIIYNPGGKMQCTLPDPPTEDYSDSLEKFYKESAVVVTQHRSEDNMTRRNRAEPDCKNFYFFSLKS